MSPTCLRLLLFAALLFDGVLFSGALARGEENHPFSKVQPFFKTYCFRCHGEGDESHGDVDFTKIKTPEEVEAAYELWERAAELVAEGTMPPDDAPQPTNEDKAALQQWYDLRFVQVQPHPGYFRPRRLSAYEYRNTLHSLLGFKLEVAIREAEQTVTEKSLVMKLLPLDPPGPSSFTNDTSANPLTTNIWDQSSYLVDNALERLFSPKRRDALEAYTGPLGEEVLNEAQAIRLLKTLAPRAYRRELDARFLEKPIANLKGKLGPALETALRAEIKAILMSPPFLYRGLLMDIPRDKQTRVDDFELAERLSYFLWADMPDEELTRLASQSRLREPATLTKQIDRMLASPKARSLAEDFGVQWFSLNEIDNVSNNPPVADALKTQPVDFLHYLFTQQRPLIELLDSSVTFINPHTAKYYPRDRRQMAKYRKQKGIEVERVPNQQITLHKTPERGGLLTMPGVLAMNKGPVLRGTWMLERILGQRLPEPPPDVGQVQPNKSGENLTFRQRFELHRSKASCAVCHDKIDPLGFALQAYDAKGGFAASSRVDTSGQLPSGEKFNDFAGLKEILVGSQRERVIRNIVRRTMAYALCRRLTPRDRPVVESIVEDMLKRNGTFRDLIQRIAESLPFQQTIVRSEANRG